MNVTDRPATRPEDEAKAPGAALATVTPDEDDGENISLFTEFVWFVRENKKWWLVPLAVIVVVMAGLIVLGTNPATAPFIYSLL